LIVRQVGELIAEVAKSSTILLVEQKPPIALDIPRRV